jgi:DNA polymerase III alpha subunit
MGCFYVESPATRLLLKKLWTTMPPAQRAQADVFEYLVAVSSIIRPAANVFADDFVRRAHGQPYRALHPLLETVLAETHGIMVYQEDVMKVAVALGGFSVHDGDQLRKVLSKKHKERQLRDYQRQFYAGAAARQISRAVVDQVWAMMMSFAGYSFCKPHSASYAQVSFKSAYLRAHYPAEFLAAVISNQGGYYSAFAYLSEGRRMGLTILPPDINASDWAYRGSGRAIRVGLMQLKALREDFAKHIVAEREARGPYRSLQHFLDRLTPEIAQTTLLIKAGCFDSVAGELTRPALIWRLFADPRVANPVRVTCRFPRSIPLTGSSRTSWSYSDFPSAGIRWIASPTCAQACRLSRERPGPARRQGRSRLLGWMVTEKIVSTKKASPWSL